MKKDAEIKILEQIHQLILKLFKGDTYFKDDLPKYVDANEIGTMMANIKNDFPFFHQTNLKYRLLKSTAIYKKYYKHWKNKAIIADINAKSANHIIKELEVEMKSIKQFREKLLNVILDMVYASSPEEAEALEKEIMASFPIDLVVMQKAQRGYPMTGEELRHLKESLDAR